MRKLFLSVPAAIKAMAEGRVTAEDLENALFYLDTSNYRLFKPLGPDDELIALFSNLEEAKRACDIFLGAFLRAHQVGRAELFPPRGVYGLLDSLLVKNGFNPLRIPEGDDGTYSHVNVETRVKFTDLPLQVIYQQSV